MSYRREQLESTLQRALGKLIAEGLNDPRIEGLVSVTEVRVADDGHTARVGVSVLPAEKQRTALRGLRAAAGHLRRRLDRELSVRTMPHLEFHADESLKKQARVLSEIREAVAEEGRAGRAADESSGPMAEDES